MRHLIFTLLALCLLPATAIAAPIQVRVVVVTTFEIGTETNDQSGEFHAWIAQLPETIAFPQGYRSLRYNPRTHVLGIVTGEGSLHGAASIMALGMDPRFDLSHAYWVVAGIAGIDPNAGSVGSAAWAEWLVDRDLNFEIDPREMPADWTTGHVPLGRTKPYELPVPALERISGTNGYHLDPGLVSWAYALTKSVKLADTPALRGIRAGYPGYPNAQKPPFVMKGDEVVASDWWIGKMMTDQAEQWMSYWTSGKGHLATTAMEDGGVLQSLTFLSHAGKVDLERVLVLRTAANYSVPPVGETAAQLLAQEATEDAVLSAYRPSLDAAYEVASPVVNELATHWDTYRDHTPSR